MIDVSKVNQNNQNNGELEVADISNEQEKGEFLRTEIQQPGASQPVIKVVQYDKILAKKSSKTNLNNQGIIKQPSDNMSVKSEEARKYIINRDKMVFGSLSQREN